MGAWTSKDLLIFQDIDLHMFEAGRKSRPLPHLLSRCGLCLNFQLYHGPEHDLSSVLFM
jgi:hypothetical protein